MIIEKSRIPVRDIVIFGFLPGFLKKTAYRLKGYKIGRHVRLSFGAVICGKHVVVGENTSIGFFSILRGNVIHIGSHVNIGSVTFIDTPNVEIGSGTRINEQVFIGGLQDPDSSIHIGKNCQIMQMSFINPAKSITIGDDSGIGGHSLIFGHASWLSRFEGYPVEFKPIVIGKSVSISWRVFVMPGVNIGDGTVISADSLVNRDIPGKCLAAGYPARVISKYPDFPKEVNSDGRVGILKNIESEMISYFQKAGLKVEKINKNYKIDYPDRSWFISREKTAFLHMEYEPLDSASAKELNADVLVSLNPIPEDILQMLADRKIMWIDIATKRQSKFENDLGSEVALYLRRYGVRLTRV